MRYAACWSFIRPVRHLNVHVACYNFETQKVGYLHAKTFDWNMPCSLVKFKGDPKEVLECVRFKYQKGFSLLKDYDCVAYNASFIDLRWGSSIEMTAVVSLCAVNMTLPDFTEGTPPFMMNTEIPSRCYKDQFGFEAALNYMLHGDVRNHSADYWIISDLGG